jgi:hypothetical protein
MKMAASKTSMKLKENMKAKEGVETKKRKREIWRKWRHGISNS